MSIDLQRRLYMVIPLKSKYGEFTGFYLEGYKNANYFVLHRRYQSDFRPVKLYGTIDHIKDQAIKLIEKWETRSEK